jgi:hypothetical protein
MPTWKLQTSFAMDTTFPRDRMVITPHFDDGSAITGPQGLCDDLAAALDGWTSGTQEIQVKAYDVEGTPPVFPAAEAIVNPGAAPASNVPREVAVCLSFYAERNLPRQRGRLYIPLAVTGLGAGVEPDSLIRQKVADLVPIFANLGGTDVDWCVWSPTTQTMRSVTNWWVDNEWDTVRSRGLRASERLEGTVDEG